MKSYFILFSFLVLFGCGRDEKKDPIKNTTPISLPETKPVEEAPVDQKPFPFPIPFPIPGGGQGFPEICKRVPFPIPGCPKSDPAPSPGDSGDNSDSANGDLKGLLEEVNAARAKRGLSAIAIDTKLSCAAQKHSLDIGEKRICGHTGSDGSSPWSRSSSCGTSANGEIVACGQGDAKSAVQAWTFSPGHAAIMYDPSQKYMGGGLHKNYWTVIFRK